MMKDKVTHVLCCTSHIKAMHISLTGVWVALCVCARLTVGRWSLSEEESATSCMSSLSTPTLRSVRSFIHYFSQFRHSCMFHTCHISGSYPPLPFLGSNFCNRQTNPNGDCSHFCFPAPDSQRVCGCPYGMKLSPNQQTCVEDPSNEPPTLQCGANSFSCGNGKCVPNNYRCDGVDDCHDNSDEINCGINSNVFFVFFLNPVDYTDTTWSKIKHFFFLSLGYVQVMVIWYVTEIIIFLFLDTTCSPSAFTCASQHCVPAGWRCDGHNDCFDNSDEINCPTHVPGTCPANQFTCANHRCIPHTWRCDTDNDCGDSSDEADCSECLCRD